jgi:hypothetical protein
MYCLVSAIMDGYPTFVISILFIGVCTAVIGDVAGHLGCFIYLKDCVNAIAFVALGTSVPGNVYKNQLFCVVFKGLAALQVVACCKSLHTPCSLCCLHRLGSQLGKFPLHIIQLSRVY